MIAASWPDLYVTSNGSLEVSLLCSFHGLHIGSAQAFYAVSTLMSGMLGEAHGSAFSMAVRFKVDWLRVGQI